MEVEQYADKLHVWGGVSTQGNTRLVFWEGDLNADKYCKKILSKVAPDFTHIFGAHNWTFVHDGASAHKAASTNTWLRRNVPNHITSGPFGEWPAKSPDLNIIEQVRAHESRGAEITPTDFGSSECTRDFNRVIRTSKLPEIRLVKN